MTKKRTVVMNDDILCQIFDNLSIKQLFRLESVSQQFKDCVEYCLKWKTGMRLGKKFQNLKCFDKNHSVIGGSVRRCVAYQLNSIDITYEVSNNLKSFGSVLEKCPNIQTLYFNECRLNAQVFQLIADNCKQLKCLTLAANFISEDMEEWKQITAEIMKLDLRHLAIIGQCFEYRTRHFSSHIQEFSPKVNYLVKNTPNLEQLVVYWYADPLDTLINCLPPTIRSLRLIRSTRLSTHQLSLLNSGNFPLLKEMKMDINFYGRTHESDIFSLICQNLNLDSLIFYCDNKVETTYHLGYTNLQKFKLKTYEKQIWDSYPIKNMVSLKYLYLQNTYLRPDKMKKLVKRFPNLKDLTLKNFEVLCVCVHYDTDGESHLIFGNYNTRCPECNTNCIKELSELPNLKRLRLYSNNSEDTVKGLKYLKGLSVLELPKFFTAKYTINHLTFATLNICESRLPFSVPFTIISNYRLIQRLRDNILNFNSGVIPDNLCFHIREYREKPKMALRFY